MKEKELYKIIGNLRPDDCLKTRISSAVESKDNIRKERRPIFVPALMMLLVCVNLGAIAMFFSNDRLNSHWGSPEVSGNEWRINSPSEMVTMRQQIDDFIAEMSEYEENYNYLTYYSDDSADPYGVTPWYELGEPQNGDGITYVDGDIPFRRYVQTMPARVNGKKIYTDHEYLVRYDGNGFEYENIVYVIESDAYILDESILDDNLAQIDLSYSMLSEDLNYFDSAYGELNNYNVLMFENANLYHFIRFYEEYTEYDETYDSVVTSTKPIPLNDGDLDFMSRSDYWKIPDENSEIVMPNIQDMVYPVAKEILDKYGFDYRHIFTNDYHENVDDEFNLTVSSYFPNSPVTDRNESINIYLYNVSEDDVKQDYGE